VIAELLTNNYKEILTCARRIIRRRDYTLAEELISETYLALHEKEVPNTGLEFIKYFVTSMKLMTMSPRTSFNKIQRPSGVPLEYDLGNDDYKQIFTDIDAIGKSESTKELMTELSHLTKENAIKYVEVMEYKDTLAPWDRELFEMNIEKGLSGRKIVKLKELESGTKMSYKTYNNRIKQIKKGFNGNN